MNIVIVSGGDLQGGGNLVGYRLHNEYKELGDKVLMVVPLKASKENSVIKLDFHNSNNWENWCQSIKINLKASKKRGAWKLAQLFDLISNPKRYYYNWAGRDYFASTSFRKLYKSLPWVPDVFHFNVMHGYGLNLHDLIWLSEKHKVFLTLHDGWTFSGHCAHSFECTKWKTGCGNCPDLTIPPAVNRDATHFNWKQKKEIFSKSKLYIATPCQWLMEKVNQSILRQGIVASKVIPNGIDTKVFSPRDKAALRRKYNFDSFDFILLFASNGIKKKRWKNFAMLNEVIEQVGKANTGKKALMIALGDNSPSMEFEHAKLIFLPYSTDPTYVAELFSMSDVYLHASNMDTFPNVVLEAISSGVPVIATAVGGIPEQIKGLAHKITDPAFNSFDLSEATGILMANNDARKMTEAVNYLLLNEEVKETLGKNARAYALKNHTQELQVSRYSDWYKEVLNNSNS